MYTWRGRTEAANVAFCAMKLKKKKQIPLSSSCKIQPSVNNDFKTPKKKAFQHLLKIISHFCDVHFVCSLCYKS